MTGIQGLASSEQARRVTDRRRERRWQMVELAERSSARGDGEKAAISLMPDTEGTHL